MSLLAVGAALMCTSQCFVERAGASWLIMNAAERLFDSDHAQGCLQLAACPITTGTVLQGALFRTRRHLTAPVGRGADGVVAMA
jgi:hypothetical protein